MRALILAYHSHHMVGGDYTTNDHIALATDLGVIDRAGCQIISAEALMARVRLEQSGMATERDDATYVALTFDDGPEYDAVDFEHPQLGLQRSFLGILEDFAQTAAGKRQQHVCATSFVIASPAARKTMEVVTTAPYFLHPGAMNDNWWSTAVDSGRIAIGNHSWDHLHPALAAVAHSRDARADFTQVDNAVDADAQILQAGRYINERIDGRMTALFAYPFGHYNRFLIEDYFPGNERRTGVAAAFTVDARPLRTCESVWCVPRYSCGYNWSTPDELAAILASIREAPAVLA